MKISKENLSIVSSNLDQSYHVEFYAFDTTFKSSGSLNKIICEELIEQINGLELTEKNVLVRDTEDKPFQGSSVITYPALLEIIFNGERILAYYLDFIHPDPNMILPNYDILSLKVLKNKLVSN